MGNDRSRCNFDNGVKLSSNNASDQGIKVSADRHNGFWRGFSPPKAHSESKQAWWNEPPGLLLNLEGESVDKPGSVLDCHSSGQHVTMWLKRPTREQRGPRHRSPIWPCSQWGLPCHDVLPRVRCALTAPFHPYLCRITGHRRSTLCCTFRRLTPPRCYLALRPMEPGLSSALRRDNLTNSTRKGIPIDNNCNQNHKAN